MKFYFAPMEGITGYIFRRIHHRYFPGVDKYFTPFLAPNQNRTLKTREKHDVLPEHNIGMPVVPQILTNQADAFIWMEEIVKNMGYEEVNLNLGCPSGTVVSKKKGAGFLSETVQLDRFLEEIFKKPLLRISIKTRIGKDSPEEWEELLEIFNRYPIEELIVHPRIQKDLYRNQPNMEAFAYAVKESKNKLCYNGNIFSVQDYKQFQTSFPYSNRIMLGRGLLRNPALVGQILGKNQLTKEKLFRFHDELCEEYRAAFSGERDVLFKMKELWLYLIELFPENEQTLKKIKKCQKLSEFRREVETLIQKSHIESDESSQKRFTATTFGL